MQNVEFKWTKSFSVKIFADRSIYVGLNMCCFIGISFSTSEDENRNIYYAKSKILLLVNHDVWFHLSEIKQYSKMYEHIFYVDLIKGQC